MKKGVDKLRLNAKAQYLESSEYHFSLGLYVFQEKGNYIAYCPSLDISTSGSDFNAAIASFYECFQLHIECCIEMGTLYKDLEAHGWRLRAGSIQPPEFSTLMKKQEMKELMGGNIGFERVMAPARIPVAL